LIRYILILRPLLLYEQVLAALSVSICLTFLLESNQLVNQYLNSIQLRCLFALLVGVFSATATLCIDLRDPFSGSFSVAGTSAQVGDLRLCLLEDVREAKSDASVLSSSTFRFFPSPKAEKENTTSNGKPKPMNGPSRRDISPSRYGNNFFSTVYFHLLTGPLGSNVRALGELVAWAATIVWKKTRPESWRRKLWPWTKRGRPKASLDVERQKGVEDAECDFTVIEHKEATEDKKMDV